MSTRTLPPTLTPDAAAALALRVRSGELRAAARLMRLLDDRVPGAEAALKALHPLTGHARVVGITGNPGSGKSTLTDQLIAHYRRGVTPPETIGVVAVDPSSPYSGGAILGDRIRMMDHAADPGVFIRSLATRGQLGGLSRSTDDVIQVLDAMGKDRILVETVGVGQDEIDIVKTAETAIVVLVPGLGDDVQAIKAGILEIADIFVVNKADRDGALRTVSDLKQMQSLGQKPRTWEPPILSTVATRGEGIAAVAEAIEAHRQHLASDPERLARRQRERAAHRFRTILMDRVAQRLGVLLAEDARLETLCDRLVHRELDPYTAADELLARFAG